MLSIITPTMWQYEPYCDFIANVVRLDTVGEIIIINNNKSKTPEHPVLKHPKVKLHNFDQNIFVNPAWNLGAKTAQFDKLCFLSDDVIVDLKLFFEIDPLIKPELGPFAVGMTPEIHTLNSSNGTIPINNLNGLINDGIIKICEYARGGNIAGLGALFFCHKSNWVDIPEEMLINFGDGWVFDTQHIMGKPLNFINNVFFYSPWNVTSRSKDFGISPPVPADLHERENNEKYRFYKARWVRQMGLPMPKDLEGY